MPGTYNQNENNTYNKNKMKNNGNKHKKIRALQNQGLNYNPDKPKVQKNKNIKHPLMLLRIGFFSCMTIFIIMWASAGQFAMHSLSRKLMRGFSFLFIDLGCILLYIWPRYYYEVVNIISLRKFNEDQKEKETKVIRRFIIGFIVFTTIVMFAEMFIS